MTKLYKGLRLYDDEKILYTDTKWSIVKWSGPKDASSTFLLHHCDTDGVGTRRNTSCSRCGAIVPTKIKGIMGLLKL